MFQNYPLQIVMILFVLLNIPSVKAKTNATFFQQQDSIDQVFVQTAPEDVMEKINKNLKRNYNASFEQFSVKQVGDRKNTMENILVNFKKLSFVDGNKREQLNKQFDTLFDKLQNTTSKNIYNYSYQLALGKNDSLKVAYDSALSKRGLDGASSSLMSQVFTLLRKSMKTKNTFKVKSGLFKIGDSVDLKNAFSFSDSIQPKTKRKGLKKLWQKANFRGRDYFQFIKRYPLYKFTIDGQTKVDGEQILILKFEPESRSADYEGKLYVSLKDFAVLKMTYKLAKGRTGKGINMKFLLGIKSTRKKNTATYIYQKTADGHYVPKYIDFTVQDYHYVNRHFKLKENTDARGRIKIRMKVKAEGTTTETGKYLFQDMTKIGHVQFQQFTEKSVFLICEKL